MLRYDGGVIPTNEFCAVSRSRKVLDGLVIRYVVLIQSALLPVLSRTTSSIFPFRKSVYPAIVYRAAIANLRIAFVDFVPLLAFFSSSPLRYIRVFFPVVAVRPRSPTVTWYQVFTFRVVVPVIVDVVIPLPTTY